MASTSDSPASRQFIRAAQPPDLEAITAIYAHYVLNTFVTFQTSPPTLDRWRHDWQQAQQSSRPWVVSERDGIVCGYAIAWVYNPKPAYSPTVETSIYLHRDFLGEGIGRGLYEALLSAAAERSFHLAVAGIALPNERSIALHESLGFRAVGVFEQVGHKLGDWRDVGWWQRPL